MRSSLWNLKNKENRILYPSTGEMNTGIEPMILTTEEASR